MPTEFEQRAQALRLALIDGDAAAARTHQDWLMGEVAASLLHQDAQTLMALSAAVADLPPLADRHGDGRKGDRWRAVGELLDAIGETVRPLEQVRLARAETYTGEVLRLILGEPGIAPKVIAERTGRQPNHVSNTLRALLDQGLVYRLPQGRTARYFAEESARELVGGAAPSPAVSPFTGAAANDDRYRYLDEGRAWHSHPAGQRPAFQIPVGAGAGR